METVGRLFERSPLACSLGYLTRVVQIQIREFIRNGEPLVISPTTFSILTVVHGHPGIRQSKIATLLSLKESNLALLVQQMKKDGLIEPRQLERGRKGGLGLTAGGEALFEAQEERFRSIDRNYAEILCDQEYAELVQLLSRVYAAGLDRANADSKGN